MSVLNGRSVLEQAVLRPDRCSHPASTSAFRVASLSSGESGNLRRNYCRKASLMTSTALAITLTYTVAEVIGGLIAGSLALVADAGHMLSDNFSFGLALLAFWLSAKPPRGILRSSLVGLARKFVKQAPESSS